MFYWASLCAMKVLSVGRSITHVLKLFFSRFYGQHFCVGNSTDFILLFRVFISAFYEFILSDDETKWNKISTIVEPLVPVIRCVSYCLTAQCKEWTCRREVLSRIIFTVTILSEMSLPVKLQQYLLIQRIIPCYGWWPNTARFVE